MPIFSLNRHDKPLRQAFCLRSGGVGLKEGPHGGSTPERQRWTRVDGLRLSPGPATEPHCFPGPGSGPSAAKTLESRCPGWVPHQLENT